MPESLLPSLLPARSLSAAWTALPSWLPVDGMGGLPVNAFLMKGPQPLLVDTGLGALGDAMVRAVGSEIALDDLRWIWLSHTDPDHIGNLAALLEAAPRAQVITNFLGRGKMQLAGYDIARVHMLTPGDVVEVNGHRLHQVRPPYYDAPETIGFFDATDRAFFAADAFGALLPSPAETAEAVGTEALQDGLVAWSSIDAPWLAALDPGRLATLLAAIDDLDPALVLSGHLPAAHGTRRLTSILASAWGRGTTTDLDPLGVERLQVALA